MKAKNIHYFENNYENLLYTTRSTDWSDNFEVKLESDTLYPFFMFNLSARMKINLRRRTQKLCANKVLVYIKFIFIKLCYIFVYFKSLSDQHIWIKISAASFYTMMIHFWELVHLNLSFWTKSQVLGWFMTWSAMQLLKKLNMMQSIHWRPLPMPQDKDNINHIQDGEHQK